MRLIVSKNVSQWAANYIQHKIQSHKKDRKFNLGLPTGGTVMQMYALLVEKYNNNKLDFSNVQTFNMDEYIGIDKNNPNSYWTFMQENLFSHVNVNKDSINIPYATKDNVKKVAKDYEEKLHSCGGIDLFVGGVGQNGHIAFNEPYSSLSSPTRDKELHPSTIKANKRFFEKEEDVPTSAITVGIDTLLQAKEVMILIKGKEKARALQKCIEGAVSHMWPISILQFHKQAIIVADEEACDELKVKTYKYFTQMKDEYTEFENNL